MCRAAPNRTERLYSFSTEVRKKKLELCLGFDSANIQQKCSVKINKILLYILFTFN